VLEIVLQAGKIQMNVIFYIELFGLLAISVALFAVIYGQHSVFASGIRKLFVYLVVAIWFSHAISALEWAGDPYSFDTLSDIVFLTIPVLWLFFFYAFLENEAQRRFRYLVNSGPSIIYATNYKDKLCTYVSDNLYEIMGYPSTAMINTTDFWFSHIHPDDAPLINSGIKNATEKGRGVLEYRLLHKDGNYRWIYDTHKVTYNDKGEPVEFVGSWTDVTDVHRLSDQLFYEESHDQLTGLYNWQECERRLNHILITSRVEKSSHALCKLDIDQFRIVNNACGHAAGNALLNEIAGLLKSRVRKSDILARLAGDEFAVLLTHCSLQKATDVAKDLRLLINSYRFTWDNRKYNISASIGIVPVIESISNAQEIFNMADIACRTAKEHGGNCARVYCEDDEASVKLRSEMQWAARIHQAIEESRFHLYWQPIVSVKSPSKIHHYEVLLRMEDENGDLIPPGLFLPPAEKYGLSTKIDQWVINAVFELLASNPEKLKKVESCAINLSGQSIGNEDVLTVIISNIEKGNIPPQKICFEITETAVVANMENAKNFMNVLKRYGCKFSLDDFGAGLSSFAYLKALPVDYLKIDGAFVKNIVGDPRDYALVKSINEIGHIMGKKTIAEFVENNLILEKLKEIGVNYAQGYGIGKPEPIIMD
jgi:diguanylate cyclase (GGDEF)-like protein/PAS domain S-box-containing protein